MRNIYGEEQFKIAFLGEITSIQPRSNVWRYLVNNRTHLLTGAEDEEKEFSVAISEKQQQKFLFHIDDVISGTGWTKKYPEIEYTATSKILFPKNRKILILGNRMIYNKSSVTNI